VEIEKQKKESISGRGGCVPDDAEALKGRCDENAGSSSSVRRGGTQR